MSFTRPKQLLCLGFALAGCSIAVEPTKTNNVGGTAAGISTNTAGANAAAAATPGSQQAGGSTVSGGVTSVSTGFGTNASIQGDGPQPVSTPTPAPYKSPTNLALCTGTPVTNLSADITSNQTLSGTINVTKSITIKPGAAVTVSDCATFALAAGATISVGGSLTVAGPSTMLTPFTPSGSSTWGGVLVLAGGSASLTNVYMTKGDIGLECQTGAVGCNLANSTLVDNALPLHVSSTATVTNSVLRTMAHQGVRFEPGSHTTVTNSILYDSQGDVIGMNGGTLLMSKVKVGGVNYQHCGFHINAADDVEIHDSELASNYYAFMVGSTAKFIVTNNNIRQSQTSHLLYLSGAMPSPDISNNYWDSPAGFPQDFVTQAGVTGAIHAGTKTTAIPGLGPTITDETQSLALNLGAGLGLVDAVATVPVTKVGESCAY